MGPVRFRHVEIHRRSRANTGTRRAHFRHVERLSNDLATLRHQLDRASVWLDRHREPSSRNPQPVSTAIELLEHLVAVA
jgi:hypothetical protein